MTYQETLDFLYSQLPMYQKVGVSAINLGLDRTLALSAALNRPHRHLKTIHVAGTNGKGTSSHLIAAILQAQGYRVGLYTSPHYKDFRERIKVNGEYIAEEEVRSFVERIQPLLSDIKPSFFEMTVVMAFDHFVRHSVDFAVIETGLGGRLDSTNIIDPLVSVITHISLDHQRILGDNEYLIAHEKAGIIKKETPVVIGRYQVSCDSVFFEKSSLSRSALSFASLKWHTRKSSLNDIQLKRKNDTLDICVSKNDLYPFFLENVITALETVFTLQLYGNIILNKDRIEWAIANFRSLTSYIGRWQLLSANPLIVADSAHNADAIAKVLEYIESLSFERLHFILGFVKDKDVLSLLRLFPPRANYYFTQPSLERKLELSDLKELATSIGLIGNYYDTVTDAIRSAKESATDKDIIFIGGSSFVVAEAI